MEHLKRVVEPIQIEFNEGQWDVVSFCKIRKDYISAALENRAYLSEERQKFLLKLTINCFY